MMTLTPTTLCLIAVLLSGYLAAIGFGTLAYFANDED